MVVAAGLGEVAAGRAEVELGVLDLEAGLHAQLEPLLGHLEQPLGLRHRSLEGAHDLARLAHAVDRRADLQRDLVLEPLALDLLRREVGGGLAHLADGLQAVEEREVEVDAGGPRFAARPGDVDVPVLPAVAPLEVEARLVPGLGDRQQLAVDGDGAPLRGEVGALAEGDGERGVVVGRGADRRRQRARGVHVFRNGEEEAELVARRAHGVPRGEHLGARVLQRDVGGEDVVVGRRAEQVLAPRLVEVALLLGDVLLGDRRQLARQQHVVEGGGHVARRRLAVDEELVVGHRQPDLGGADRRADLPPGEERLGDGEVGAARRGLRRELEAAAGEDLLRLVVPLVLGEVERELRQRGGAFLDVLAADVLLVLLGLLDVAVPLLHGAERLVESQRPPGGGVRRRGRGPRVGRRRVGGARGGRRERQDHRREAEERGNDAVHAMVSSAAARFRRRRPARSSSSV